MMAWTYEVFSKSEKQQSATVRLLATEHPLQAPPSILIDAQVSVPWNASHSETGIRLAALSQLNTLIREERERIEGLPRD